MLDPEPLGLDPGVFDTVPEMAAEIRRLMPRLDEPAPRQDGCDERARAGWQAAEQWRLRINAGDRVPGDWARAEHDFRAVAQALARAHDPWVSAAWLGVARSSRYQRDHRNATLSAFIEALHWWPGNADAWLEFLDYASAAPHVRTLRDLFARVPLPVRPPVLALLTRMCHGQDRLGRLTPLAASN